MQTYYATFHLGAKNNLGALIHNHYAKVLGYTQKGAYAVAIAVYGEKVNRVYSEESVGRRLDYYKGCTGTYLESAERYFILKPDRVLDRCIKDEVLPPCFSKKAVYSSVNLYEILTLLNYDRRYSGCYLTDAESFLNWSDGLTWKAPGEIVKPRFELI